MYLPTISNVQYVSFCLLPRFTGVSGTLLAVFDCRFFSAALFSPGACTPPVTMMSVEGHFLTPFFFQQLCFFHPLQWGHRCPLHLVSFFPSCRLGNKPHFFFLSKKFPVSCAPRANKMQLSAGGPDSFFLFSWSSVALCISVDCSFGAVSPPLGIPYFQPNPTFLISCFFRPVQSYLCDTPWPAASCYFHIMFCFRYPPIPTSQPPLFWRGPPPYFFSAGPYALLRDFFFLRQTFTLFLDSTRKQDLFVRVCWAKQDRILSCFFSIYV